MSVLALLDPATRKARLTGRSWWLVRYADGRVVNEWDGPDWSLLPRKGLVAVRLACPNGKVAELGNSVDASDRLFQLKVAVRTMGAGKQVMAHVVGIVTGTDGACRCAAWEPDPGRLVQFEDNAHAMRYQGIGALSPDVLGLKAD